MCLQFIVSRQMMKILIPLTCLLLSFKPSFSVNANDEIRKQHLVLAEELFHLLGWTDTHHVAYGTSIIEHDGHTYATPKSVAPDFLEAASDDYLRLQNKFGQTALHLAVQEVNLDLVKLYIERQLLCINTGNKDGDTTILHCIMLRNGAELSVLDCV